MKKMKVGELVNFNEDAEIIVDDKKLTVKKGDYGVVASNKTVHVLTGECFGIDVPVKDMDVDGYDIPSMAATIHLGLESAYNINKIVDRNHLIKNLQTILKKIFR